MNRLQNAQKQLAESLAALESAVEIAQNSTGLTETGNGAGTVDAGGSGAPSYPAPAIDIGQLSQDLTAIEADLETAMKMIANLTASGLSSNRDKDSP